MNARKFGHLLFLLMVLVSLIGTNINVSAMPANPTDETKVPHYFGPYPNWANSPFTLPDVAVEILGNGVGAAAVASVGANGAVTGITITDPGSGYTYATVNITGAGTGATASATVATSGAVTGLSRKASISERGNTRSWLILESSVMMSSVMPSRKYSSSLPPLRFSK